MLVREPGLQTASGKSPAEKTYIHYRKVGWTRQLDTVPGISSPATLNYSKCYLLFRRRSASEHRCNINYRMLLGTTPYSLYCDRMSCYDWLQDASLAQLQKDMPTSPISPTSCKRQPSVAPPSSLLAYSAGFAVAWTTLSSNAVLSEPTK